MCLNILKIYLKYILPFTADDVKLPTYPTCISVSRIML